MSHALAGEEGAKELATMRSVLLDSPIHPEALALLERQVTVLPMYRASLSELRQALATASAAIVSTRFRS